MGHFARECRAPRSQDKERRDNYRQRSKVEEHAPKALMAIDGVGWDWSFMGNEEENHALVIDEEAPTEFSLMAKTSFQTASKDLNSLLESQRSDKNKEGLGYSVVPPSYSSLFSRFPTGNSRFSTADVGNKGTAGNSQNHIDDKGCLDGGCS
nr:hypothetical protein [Tanacetum cinerariifolium]